MKTWESSGVPVDEDVIMFYDLLSEAKFSDAGELFKDDDPFFNTRLVNSALNMIYTNPWDVEIPESHVKAFFAGTLIQNNKMPLVRKWAILEDVLKIRSLGALEALGEQGVFTAQELNQKIPAKDCREDWTPLTLVATTRPDQGVLPLMKCLVAFGAEVNIPGCLGLTPLAVAVNKGSSADNLEAIKWLLTKAGANPNLNIRVGFGWVIYKTYFFVVIILFHGKNGRTKQMLDFLFNCAKSNTLLRWMTCCFFFFLRFIYLVISC